MSATAAFSRWIADTQFEDLPAPVIEHVKWCFSDSIACGLGGRASREGDALVKLARIAGGAGRATIMGEPERNFSLLQAAQANRVLINVLDYDDTIIRTGHMSSVAVAAGLAIGEQFRSSGRDLIAALAMAYEGVLRLRHAVSPSLEVFRTSFERVDCGVYFCATIAAGKLLQLGPDAMSDAFGLTGHIKPWHVTMPPMSEEGMPEWFKVTQGDVVVAGMQAALLAKDGFPGDRGIFDAERGFERLVGSDRYDTEPLTRGPDAQFDLLDIGFKYQTCCRHISAFVDGLEAIKRRDNIVADDIAGIAVRAHRWTVENLDNRHPAHMIGAQFSMPHALAMTALGVPSGSSWFTKEALENPAAARLRQLVKLEPDARAQTIYDEERRYAGEVMVDTRDGRRLRYFTEAPRGARHNPFTETDHEEKLTRMAEQAGLKSGAIRSLWQALRHLEDVSDLNAVTRLLAP